MVVDPRASIRSVCCARIEVWAGCRLHETFDLIYGTSTGAIIGALLSAQELSTTLLRRTSSLSQT